MHCKEHLAVRPVHCSFDIACCSLSARNSPSHRYELAHEDLSSLSSDTGQFYLYEAKKAHSPADLHHQQKPTSEHNVTINICIVTQAHRKRQTMNDQI